ncbi:hypothetical protein RRG08_037457 [Elysia crispata]|uniref:Uncharacterized protein n=1 Tax=Elysia crispata TaxID=231223 RepID=A0AAE1CMR3_9GAST|nr:hypothetical protein RRG08_037457 [Elysia crispata]
MKMHVLDSTKTRRLISNKKQPPVYICLINGPRPLYIVRSLSCKDAPQVIFTLDPAQATFSKGDNLEFKYSGQGNPEPTLTLTKTETTKDLIIIVQTTELTPTLTLTCPDTGV